MKIITWNVNGIRAVAKKGLFEFISKLDPDILCLQETKAHPEQVEPELLNPFGRHGHWSVAQRPGYSGTVTYAKTATKDVHLGIGIKKFDSEGRFVITDHGDFLLYNVYFPNGGAGEERHLFKQEFLKKITLHLKTHISTGREIILVGDYNVAHRDIDVYDPKKLTNQSGFLPEERAWFSEFLSLGFVDLFRNFHPEARHRYTWWSYLEKARLGNRGWRIDYICATKKLAGRFTCCEILDDVTGSDHCPVVAELD
ncbi:MAG: exodeoxyribonuclease III [Bdellovibrionales bacterium RBG_16_40_8]|nr:MAG: exodeoxyribonuclease III [Bdellovibrionales bacterium RBG_16_40_8]